MNVISKLNLILGLKAVHGAFKLKCLMQKVTTSLELYMMDLEEGDPKFIPYNLSLDSFPHSFRYYDPIIAIIQEQFSPDRTIHFTTKSKIAFEIHKQKNLGILEEDTSKPKLICKDNSVNK